MARGIRAVCPRAAIEIVPLSDGGDGLLEALEGLPGAVRLEAHTCDALGRPLQAAWLETPSGAIIESALASGLARLRPDEYDPLAASSAGTGRLIRAALERGCRRIVLGLGGSATVDAGCGLAAELGFRLLDGAGRRLPPGGGALKRLERIDGSGVEPRLSAVSVTCLVDVRNPLLGPEGAARVYGPQKGATPAAVERLEAGLARWSVVAQRDLKCTPADWPGAGAAGGLGAGCAAFLDASLTPGAAWVARRNGLTAALARADLVITGEGRIDAQTACGKVPAFVARRARAAGKPVLALGGAVVSGTDLSALGVACCRAATPPGMPIERALREAPRLLARAAERLIRDWLANRVSAARPGAGRPGRRAGWIRHGACPAGRPAVY